MSLRIAFDCDGVIADLDSALDEIVARLFGEAAPPDTATPGQETPPEQAASPDRETPPQQAAPPAPAAASVGNTQPPDGHTQPADGAARPPEGEASTADGPTDEEVQAAPARFRALTRRQQHDLWEAVRKTENFWESLKETEPGVIARLATLARERRWEVIFITQRPSSAGDITQLQTQRWLVAHGYDLPSVYVIKGTRGKVAEALTLDVVVDDRPENCLDVKLESRARAILVWKGDFASLPPNTRRFGIEPVVGIGACLDLLAGNPAAKKLGLLGKIKRLVGA